MIIHNRFVSVEVLSMCYKQKKVDIVLVCMIQRTKRAYSLLFLNPKTLHMTDSHVAVPEAW